MPRRIVPFGSHWAMGIEVPYSLGVIDDSQFWSCGQCPLDLRAEVLAPNDLRAQLGIVADLIRRQFGAYGITTESIAKLVAYVAGDADELAHSERILRKELAPVPLVIAAGVPPFYYPGMRVEVDVYGAEQAAVPVTPYVVRSGDLFHIVCPAEDAGTVMANAHVTAVQLLTAKFYGVKASEVPELPVHLVFDHGSIFHTGGQRAVADLVFAVHPSQEADQRVSESPGGVVVTRRSVGRYLGLLGRTRVPRESLAAAAQSIMAAFESELRREGLSFSHVAKQQTHYVGGANADDLYANMRVRNGYYRAPGPASTGLAVSRFSDPDTSIIIEVIACRS